MKRSAVAAFCAFVVLGALAWTAPAEGQVNLTYPDLSLEKVMLTSVTQHRNGTADFEIRVLVRNVGTAEAPPSTFMVAYAGGVLPIVPISGLGEPVQLVEEIGGQTREELATPETAPGTGPTAPGQPATGNTVYGQILHGIKPGGSTIGKLTLTLAHKPNRAWQGMLVVVVNPPEPGHPTGPIREWPASLLRMGQAPPPQTQMNNVCGIIFHTGGPPQCPIHWPNPAVD